MQIELPPRIRGSSPIWADWDHTTMVPHMAALIDGLVDAAAHVGYGANRSMTHAPVASRR